MPTKHPALDLLARALPAGSVSDIRYSFDCIEIAEELLSAWERKRGDGRSQGVLTLLRPTPPLYHRDERLYRSHCEEILERVSCGRPCETLTKAEVLSSALDTTLKGPPVRSMLVLIDRLWVACMGPLPAGLGSSEPEFPGQYEEVLADVRRQHKESWRILPSHYTKPKRGANK